MNVLRKIKFEYLLFQMCKLTYSKAEKTVLAARPQPYPKFEQDNTLDIKYDLMIVLPVYNAGEYLEKCLQSIINQKTQYTYHVVAVNDGSTDNSADVLKRYESDEHFTVIHQENRGHSGARNRALETIVGHYVMFVDADDYLSETAIEVLLNTAFECDADLVAGGYAQFNHEGVFATEIYGTQPQKVQAHILPGFACMKVFRAQLMKDFCFPLGMVFEDNVLPRLVFPLCNISYTVPDIVYYYRTHAGSFSVTHHTKPISLDTYWITKYCLEEHQKRGYSMEGVAEQYMQQCWINYMRTRYLPIEMQEAMFVLTSELYAEYVVGCKLSGKNKMLFRAMKRRSFRAYEFALKRWDVLS